MKTLSIAFALLLGIGSHALAQEPICSPSDLSYPSWDGNNLQLSWQSLCGSYNYMVVMSTIEMDSNDDPVDGNSYSFNSNFNSAPDPYQNGHRIVYQGSSTSAFVTGLTSSKYYLKIYSYTLGSDDYRTFDELNALTPPFGQASNIQFNSIDETSVNVSVQSSFNGDGMLLVASEGSPLIGSPAQGIQFCASSNWNSAPAVGVNGRAVAYLRGAGCLCGGQGSSSIQINGLTSGTTYYFQAFELYEDCSPNSLAGYLTSTSFNNPNSVSMPAAEPGTQASDLTFPSVGENFIELSWTPGNGQQRLVVASQFTIGLSDMPDDEFDYIANNQYGMGSSISDSYVVYKGTGNSVTVSGLTPSNNYHFQVFEFNGSGTSTNYNTQTTFNNPNDRQTCENEPPSNAASNLQFTPSINSIQVGFNNLCCSYQYLVLRSTSPISQGPVDGVEYFFNDLIGGSAMVISTGSSTFIFDNGLNVGTTYYYKVYAYSGNGGTEPTYNYNTNDALSGTSATLESEPFIPAANITFTDLNTNSMTVQWSNGSGLGRIVVASQFGFSTEHPTDGTTYTASSLFGSGTQIGTGYVVYAGSGTSVTVANLSSQTIYGFRVYEFNPSNPSSLSINYLTDDYAQNLRSTLDSPPNAPPNSPVFTFVTTSSMDLNFSPSPGGASGYLVLRRMGSAPPETPVDGTEYVTGSMFGTSDVVYSGPGTNSTSSLLSAGTTYHFAVYAFNGNGESSNYLLTPLSTSITTVPLAPNTFGASNVQATSFRANWTSTLGATSYRLDVATDPGFTQIVAPYNNIDVGSVTFFDVVSNIQGGTTYYYQVRALSSGGASSNSNDTEVLTLPAAPAALAAADIESFGFTANWLSVQSATNYLVDVSIDNGFGSFVTPYNGMPVGNTTSFPVNINLSPSQTYYYRVRAVNATGNSAFSGTITAVTEPSSQALNVIMNTPTTTSLNVTWSNGNGSARIVLARQGDNFFTDPIDFVNYNANSNFNLGDLIGGSRVVYAGNGSLVNVTNLNPDTEYFFRVYEFSPVSPSSPNINYLTLLAPGNPGSRYTLNIEPGSQPTGLTFSNHNPNFHELSFSPTAADGYLVLRKENISPTETPSDGTTYLVGNVLGSSTVVASSSSTLVLSGGLTAGTTYYYDVFAFNGSDESINYRTTLPLEGSRTSLQNEPVSQASNITFSSLAPTSLVLNWTNGTGNGRLVVARLGAPVFTDPIDGTNYTANAAFGSGSNINSSGTYVVYAGTATTVTVTNLLAESEYSFKVYEFSPASSSDPSINYLTNASPGNPGTRFTLANEPGNQATGITFSNHATNSHTVSFTGNGSQGYLVLRTPGGSPTDVPADGTSYTAGNTLGSSTIVSTSSSTSVLSSGLLSNTVYHYDIIAYNGSGTAVNYRVVTPLEGSRTTLTTEPTAANNVTFTNPAPTSLGINWTNGNGTGRLVVARQGNSSFSDPVDGTTYTANSVFGSGSNINASSSFVVYAGTASAVTVTGLTANTEYYFKVYEFAGASASDPAINYYTGPATANPGNRFTLVTAPGAQPTTIAFNSIQSTSFNTSFTPSGSTGVIALRKAGGAPGDVPVSGTAYVAGNTIGTSTVAYVGSAGSFANNSLNAGTVYHFAIFAFNGSGATTNYLTTSPLVGSQLTAPDYPALSSASSITQTSFQANWSASATATSYRIDVSTDPAFGTFVTSYQNNNVGNVTTFNVNSNLTPGTVYYYRVRAVNSGGTSPDNPTPITFPTIPANPTATAATSIGTSSFTANWASTATASGYFLDVATDNAFSTIVSGYNNVAVGNNTSYVVNTGLSAGTNYYYRVRASNASGASSNSTTITLITVPAAPVTSAASSTTQTSFAANWTSVTGAATYRIDVATNSSFTGAFVSGYEDVNVGNVLTYLVSTNLSAGTEYYYRVRAVNAGGTSASSSHQVVTTIPPDPVATSASGVTEGGFTANWNASASATGYQLDVASDAGFTSLVSGFNNLAVIGTTQSVAGLNPASTYYYRVRAFNGSGTSSNSNPISQLTVSAAPVALAASAMTNTGFTANWSVSTGATGYRLDVSPDNGFTNFVSGFQDLSVTGTSSVVGGLSPGTTYYYRVRSTNSSGTSVSSNTISQITVPAAPVANAASLITISSFVANWTAVTGATGYKLDVSDDDFATFVAGFEDLAVATTSSSVTGLSEGIIYKFRVRAVNSAGTSGNSNNISLITVPPVPDAMSATNVGVNGFTANWASVSGATTYSLDISTDDFATFIAGYNDKTLTATSEVVTGLLQNTIYKYRVRATSSSGTSANSTVTTVLTVSDAPVALAATSPSQSGFTAHWQAVAGITSYRLDVSEDGFATLVPGYDNMPVLASTQVVTGLSSGITYQYRVRAVNATSPSANSNSITIPTIPATPISAAASSVTNAGFTINWSSVAGATSYSVDVSLDNFSTFIAGYDGKVVPNASPVVLTGLLQNSAYKYRVRSTNASGSSPNSVVITVLTYPDAPVPTAATAHTQTGFTAGWQSVSGITDYRLDVSSDDFVTSIPGFNDLLVTGTTRTVLGLVPGTTYKYRVRATNSTGPSVNSTIIATITIPPTPVATSAISVTQTAFTAKWNQVAGADNYVIDVALASDFASFIPGYDGKSVAGTSSSENLTALQRGTIYYYRVRSRNSSGTSPASNIISQITIPANPVSMDVAIKSNTTFIARWQPVDGVEYYELDVSLFQSNFNSFVTGYNSRVVSGTEDELVVGLVPGTPYRYRVRAVNSAGKSGNSNVTNVQTDGGSAVPLAVSISLPNNGQFTGTALNATGTVSNFIGAITASLIRKGIAEANYQPPSAVTVDQESGAFSIVIEDSMLDEIGVEYYVEVKDEISPTKKLTSVQRVYRAYTAATSPVVMPAAEMTGDRASIRIIAIPHDLKDSNIESIFVSMGEYDKTKWRLAHYQDGANKEFGDGVLKIERGLGYWFNAKGSVPSIKTGEGGVGKNDPTTPFVFALTDGWNQIGNPYPFAIDWSDVLDDNSTVSGVGKLFTWNGTNENFDEVNTLQPFTGGFVRTTGNVTLNARVSLKATAGGRGKNPSFDIGEDSWRLPLSVTQNQSTYAIAHVGMEPEGASGRDAWDELRLPRLDEYLDITFDHPGEKSRYFSRDIVATADKAAWRFIVESSGSNENGILRWDNTRFGDNIAQVFLLDVDAMDMIDMRLVDNYTFLNPVKKEFRIYYSRNGEPIAPDLLGMGHPYPNPSSEAVSVVIALPDTQKEFTTELIAYDMMGKPIKTVNFTLSPGIHEVTWDGTESSGNRVYGVHILRARVSNNLLPNSFRVVMK